MHPQPSNTGLSQSEIDGLLSKNLDEIIRVKGAVERIDNKRDSLADFYQDALTPGKSVNVCFRNEQGVIVYSHWIGDHNRTASKRLINECVQAASGDLLRQRCAVFEQPVIPTPQRTVNQLIDPAEPLFKRPAQAQETTDLLAGDDAQVRWLTREEIVDELGLNKEYVSTWATRNKLQKMKKPGAAGRVLLYAVPHHLKKKGNV